jgi:hypothetical protein
MSAPSVNRVVVAAAVAVIAGCANRAVEALPQHEDAALFADRDCEQLFEESDRVQLRAADVAYAVDARVGNNLVALSLGATVFWPALLAIRGDGPEAHELAQLKGRHEALQRAAHRRGCGHPAETMSAERAAQLPLAVGERFVYRQRRHANAAPRELGLRVAGLWRDRIELTADLAGEPLPGLWRQDLAGNPQRADRPRLLAWQRLLQRDLQLGQVLLGELHPADDLGPPAHLRGQVVAQGPQTIAGRRFDVAVIELFGDAPLGENGSTRLNGVMAVDRRSGVLLRLEIECANADFAVHRRLVRIEPAAP